VVVESVFKILGYVIVLMDRTDYFVSTQIQHLNAIMIQSVMIITHVL